MTPYLLIATAPSNRPDRRVDFADIARLFTEDSEDADVIDARPAASHRTAGVLASVLAPLRTTIDLLREEAHERAPVPWLHAAEKIPLSFR